VLTLLSGCTSAQHRRNADREAYRILQQKQQAALGVTNEFSVDTRFSGRDPQEMRAEEIVQERLQPDVRMLTLEESLQLAIDNSRNYQLRKEQLYLSALALTGERYRFDLQPFARARAEVSRDSRGNEDGVLGSTAGVGWLLRSGGRVSATLANDILRFYTGRNPGTLASQLTLNLSQPLLRGAWADVAAENLTQAERNVIYEVRSFSQFQRTFALDIVSTYYRILRQKDTVKNNYDNYQRLVLATERAEATAQDGRTPLSQAEQAKQNELRARRSYISAARSYQETIDSFKITLGLPVSTRIALDDGVLEDLRKIGIVPIEVAEQDAYHVAVENQFELLNEIDRFEDAQRRIKVAASNLRAGLNLTANSTFNATGDIDYTKFDFARTSAEAGLELDLPIDRLPERNSYRSSLISFERQIRNLSLALDNLRSDINDGLRAMNEARRQYQIQQEELALADRRVERETLLVNAGRTEIRNLLEAQDALINAQNSITQTLVTFHIARLQFLIDIGVLDTGLERFWLNERPVLARIKLPDTAPRDLSGDGVVVPEELFKAQ
jgi:outer membrane protein TolC